MRQRKTGRPVRFELTEQTRHAIDDYIRLEGKRSGEFLFTGRRPGQSMTPRQYARLLADWLTSVGLDPHLYGTHSLRRTKATLIYRRTDNLRAVQLLLSHTKIESTMGGEVRPGISRVPPEHAETCDVRSTWMSNLQMRTSKGCE